MKRKYADMEKDYKWLENGRCKYCHKGERDDYKMDPSKLAAHEISKGHKTKKFLKESDLKKSVDDTRIAKVQKTASHNMNMLLTTDQLASPYEENDPKNSLDDTRIEEANKTISFYLDNDDCENDRVSQANNSTCTKIINNILAPYFRKILHEDVDDKPFSLFLDVINDYPNKVGVAIRYYSNCTKTIITAFLKILTLESLTTECVAEGLDVMATECRLNLNNLVGIGMDNTREQNTKNEQLFNRLCNTYSLKFFIPVLCTCYSLRKVFSEATKFPGNLPKLEFLVRETYSWFYGRSHYVSKYQDMYRTIEGDVVQNDNRFSWLANKRAVTNVCLNWDRLKKFFKSQDVALEQCYKSQLLVEIYSNKGARFHLLFLKGWLCKVLEVDAAFNSPSPDPIKQINELCELVDNEFHEEMLYSSFLNNLNYESKEALQKCEQSEHDNLVGSGKYFLLQLFSWGINYLVDNKYRNVIKNFKTGLKILHPKNCFNKDMDKKVLDLVKNSETDVTLISDVYEQWQKLRTLIQERQIKDSLLTWEWIFDAKRNDLNRASGAPPVPKLCRFVMKYLCVPLSNAEVARLFNQMYLVEKMNVSEPKLKTLNNVLMIRNIMMLSGKSFHEIELPEDVRDTFNKAIIGANVDIDGSTDDDVLGRDEEKLLLKIKKLDWERMHENN